MECFFSETKGKSCSSSVAKTSNCNNCEWKQHLSSPVKIGFRENAFETPYLKFTVTNVYESFTCPLFQVIYCVKFHWNPSISFGVNLLKMTVTFLKSLSVHWSFTKSKMQDVNILPDGWLITIFLTSVKGCYPDQTQIRRRDGMSSSTRLSGSFRMTHTCILYDNRDNWVSSFIWVKALSGHVTLNKINNTTHKLNANRINTSLQN